jgi:hypothetical protein
MAMPLPSRSAHGPWGIPESLADLRGPTHETVSLPLHLCWSGACSFDVNEFSPRLRMYQILVTEGDREEIESFVDAGHLMTVWPMLRRLLHSRYTKPWEERFPELAEAAKAAEPALQEQLKRARQAAKEGRPV